MKAMKSNVVSEASPADGSGPTNAVLAHIPLGRVPSRGVRLGYERASIVFGLAAAMTLLCLGLGAGLLAADAGTTNVTVEVLIFSGRPNPTWQLQDTKALQVLKARLNDLSETSKQEPAEWSRSGFAGFRIRGGETLGLPGEIRVYRGVVKTGHGKTVKYLKDATGLEQSLINEAKNQALEQPVKDVIASYKRSRKAAQ